MQVVRPPTPNSLQDLLVNVEHAAAIVLIHGERAGGLFSNMDIVRKGSQVALLNLIQHADSIQQASDTLQYACDLEMKRMRYLLDAYEGALAALGLVVVRNELLYPSSALTNASRNGPTSSISTPQPRSLSSWINKDRMRSVAAQGQSVHDNMARQIEAIAENGRQHQAAMVALQDDAGPVSTQFASDTREEAAQASARTQELVQYVFDVASPDQNGWPVADKLNDDALASLSGATDEVILCDEVARDAIRRLTTELNTARVEAVYQLSRVSHLQSVYADYGGEIAMAQASLPIPTSLDGTMRVEYFRYLQRLVSILPAYAATVVERVRRAEFAQTFLQRSTAFAELMANFSMDDSHKRQQYDTAHRKHLPWEIRGLDRPSPSLNIKTEWTESEPEATRPSREHIYELLHLLDVIDHTLAEQATRDARTATGTNTRSGTTQTDGNAVKIVPESNSSDLQDSCPPFQQNQSRLLTPSPTQEARVLLHDLLTELDNVPGHFEELVGIHLLGEKTSDDTSSSHSGELEEAQDDRDPFSRSGTIAPPKDLPSRPRALKYLLLQERKEHQAALQAMQEERDSAVAALTRERGDTNRRAAETEELQALARHLRADADMKDQRHLNLLDELTAQRRELELLRRADRDAQQAADDDALRIVELEEALAAAQAEAQLQSDVAAAAQSAQATAEAKANQVPAESREHQAELAAAQSELVELRADVTSLRGQLVRQQEVTRAAEHEKERIKRTARAEADADAALVARLQVDADSAARDLGSARRAARAAAADADALTEALAALRAQLAAADEDHVALTHRVESADRARQAADTAASTAHERYLSLLFPAAQWAQALLAVRAALLAMPAMASRISSQSTGSATTSPARQVAPATSGPSFSTTGQTQLQQAQSEALEEFLAAFAAAAPKMDRPRYAGSAGRSAESSAPHASWSHAASDTMHKTGKSRRNRSPSTQSMPLSIISGGLNEVSPQCLSTQTGKDKAARAPPTGANFTALSGSGQANSSTMHDTMERRSSEPVLNASGSLKHGSSPSQGKEEEEADHIDEGAVDKSSTVTAPEQGAVTAWEARFELGAMDQQLLTLESALGKVYALFTPSTISSEAKIKLESLVRVVKKWMKAYRSVKDNYDRVRIHPRQSGSNNAMLGASTALPTSLAAPAAQTLTATSGSLQTLPHQARAIAGPSGDRLAFTSFLPGDLALFLPTRDPDATPGAPSARTWAAFNVSAPHHFLNTLPSEYSAGPAASAALTASLVQGKQWLVARVARVAVYTAGSADPLVVLPPGDHAGTTQGMPSDDETREAKRSFMTNPFRLPLGITYYVLDVVEYTRNGDSPPAALPFVSSSPPNISGRDVKTPVPAPSEHVRNGPDTQSQTSLTQDHSEQEPGRTSPLPRDPPIEPLTPPADRSHQGTSDPVTPVSSKARALSYASDSGGTPHPTSRHTSLPSAGVGTVGLRVSSPGLGPGPTSYSSVPVSPPHSVAGSNGAVGVGLGGLLDALRQPSPLRALQPPRAAFERRRPHTPLAGGALRPASSAEAVPVPVPGRDQVESVPSDLSNPFSSSPFAGATHGSSVPRSTEGSPAPVLSHQPTSVAPAPATASVPEPSSSASLPQSPHTSSPASPSLGGHTLTSVPAEDPSDLPNPSQVAPGPTHYTHIQTKRGKRKSSNPSSTLGSHGARSFSGRSAASVGTSLVSISCKGPRAAAQLATTPASVPVSNPGATPAEAVNTLSERENEDQGLDNPQRKEGKDRGESPVFAGQSPEQQSPTHSSSPNAGTLQDAVGQAQRPLAAAQGGLALKRSYPDLIAPQIRRTSATASESLRRLLPS